MYSIQEVVAVTGVTSRTLRHYDEIGLLPARRGRNGYRAYDQADLVRLQRVLMLRDLGLGLPEIARVLAGQTDDVSALREHLARAFLQCGIGGDGGRAGPLAGRQPHAQQRSGQRLRRVRHTHGGQCVAELNHAVSAGQF
ncbi:MAG: HTH-type transcriptional activator TipA [bacterium ADurb.Bin429]|nr:MAG: HTH-type transcriptional activator TipA [bacterium ADurb.Bin429]